MKKQVCLLIMFSFFTLFVGAQKEYTLKFNPADGSSYDAVTTVTSKIVQEAMGQQININLDYNISMLYNIVDEGANKKVQMTYNQLKMDLDAMGQKVSMNSNDADTSKDESKIFSALKGQTISVTLNSKGKVIKVEGAEDLVNRVAANEAQRQAIEGILGEDALKNILSQSFGFYPEKPVKVGDSWTDSIVIKLPYTISAISTYTLTKVEGQKAYITTISQLKTAPGSKISTNGMEMTLNLLGDMNGTSEVDIKTGMPLITEAKQSIKGDIEFQGQKIPMAMNMDIKMILTKK